MQRPFLLWILFFSGFSFITEARAVYAQSSALPAIIINGTLNSLNTTYGTSSAAEKITVSGINLLSSIFATAPAGFEISLNALSGFTSTLTLGSAGSVLPANIYIRISALTNASSLAYTGTISLMSTGAVTANSPPVSGIVSPFMLRLFLSGVDKTYGLSLGTDQNAANLPTGANSDTIKSVLVTADAAASSTYTSAGMKFTLQMSGATGNKTFLAGNYILTYQLYSSTVLPASLVISASLVKKLFGAYLPNDPVSTAFTTAGLQNNESIGTVSLTYGAGAASAALPGTYTGSVVLNTAIGGTYNPVNYLLTYMPAALIVGTEIPVITMLSQPDCSNALGTFMIQNFNSSYAYALNLSVALPMSGAPFSVPAGVYTLVATAPQSFSSPLSVPFTINPQPSAPNLVITSPAAVEAPATVNITSPSVTAGSDQGLLFSYFTDSAAIHSLAVPRAISLSGVYYVRAANAAGCSSALKAIYVIINPSLSQISIPNVFTPNGDGKNDFFEVVGISRFPGSSLYIFNRSGNEVYYSASYQNTWDGSGQMPGTYFYALNLNDKGATRLYKGWIQILR